MKDRERRTPYPPAAGLGLLAVLLSALVGGRGGIYAQPEVAPAVDADGGASPQSPEDAIRAWPKLPHSIAQAMIEKYGKPKSYTDEALVWINNGPWLKTVVFRDAWTYSSGDPDTDYLQQTISYDVPADEVGYLKHFDRRLSVDRVTGELSFRSEGEPTNYLALNLADEILKGNRSLESARDFYSQTVRLAQAGKSSPYMSGLLFQGHRFGDATYYP